MQEWLRGCRCSKVKCLKHYCVCFRNNVLCNRCCIFSFMYICAHIYMYTYCARASV